MSVINGDKGASNSSGEVKSAVFLLLLMGGVFAFTAVPVVLIVFTGPKMAAERLGMSMEVISSCQALYFVGWSTASVTILPRIYKFRRRVSAYALLAAGLAAAYASTYVTSAWSYSLCIFCMGAGMPTSSTIIYLLLVESVPSWFASTVSSTLNAGWCLVEVFIAVLSASTKAMDWRLETRLWYCPLVLFLLFGIFFVRDPQSGIADGKGRDAVDSRAGYAAVLGPDMRRCTAATCLCWCACAVSYYGLSYSAGSLSPSVHVNVALLGAVDVVSYTIALGLVAPLGPRSTQMVSFLGAGTALFACGLLPPGSWLLMACALAGRFFVNVAFVTCYLLLVACFRVECRCAVTGLSNFFARLSSLVAPFCSLLPVWVCCTLLGVLVFAAAGATAALHCHEEEGGERDELREAWLSAEPGATNPKYLHGGASDPASLLLRL